MFDSQIRFNRNRGSAAHSFSLSPHSVDRWLKYYRKGVNIAGHHSVTLFYSVPFCSFPQNTNRQLYLHHNDDSLLSDRTDWRPQRLTGLERKRKLFINRDSSLWGYHKYPNQSCTWKMILLDGLPFPKTKNLDPSCKTDSVFSFVLKVKYLRLWPNKYGIVYAWQGPVCTSRLNIIGNNPLGNISFH